MRISIINVSFTDQIGMRPHLRTSDAVTRQPSQFAFVTSTVKAIFGAVCALGVYSVVCAEEAEQTEDEPRLETVTIVAADSDQLARLPGAATIIDREQLERFAYADVQRALRQAPGIALQVEDGFGLRPNISIRGVASERSGRITLLEDNVLIAPAPYSAPSAYYFPTAGRMHSVEVLKGPSAISQGPYTIGGTLNLVSTPIPARAQGYAMAHFGEHASQRVHAWQSFTNGEDVQGLIETHQWFSNGYQNIDRSDANTGLDVRDYTAKLRFELTSNQSFELKLQSADQTSQQSYLGLSDHDFSDNPYRRYGVSALDEITTSHQQGIVTYAFDMSDATQLRISAYRNNHERTWFKTEGIDFDGSERAESLSRTSWSNVIGAVNRGEGIGEASWSDLNGILEGTLDTLPGSIQLRANARNYFSHGIQAWMGYRTEIGDALHNLEVSLRVHADEEDRLQRNSSYHQENGELVLDDVGLLGNAGNRIQEAQALALYVKNTIELGKLTFTPGVRFENIDQNRTRYEIRDGRTSDPSSRAINNLRSTRENHTRVWSPGVGASYQTTDSTWVHFGAHRGFTAPSNAPGVNEESAWIFETGIRYVSEEVPLTADVVGFLTDYDNLLGECTASSGADCDIGDAFNGDAATVTGVEAQVTTELAVNRGFSVPLNLSLTLFNGQFDTDVADTDFFGDVNRGDPIPYLPESQLQFTVGVVRQPFEGFVSVSRVGDVCVRASCGIFEKVDSSVTVDVAGNYVFNESFAIFGRVENVLNEDSIVSRHPYGARPNKARTVSVGATLNW